MSQLNRLGGTVYDTLINYPARKRMRFSNKALSFNLWHAYLDSIFPPRVSTNMVNFIVDVGRLYFATKLDDMKECVAPESNRTVTELELMVNIPSTIIRGHLSIFGCDAVHLPAYIFLMVLLRRMTNNIILLQL